MAVSRFSSFRGKPVTTRNDGTPLPYTLFVMGIAAIAIGLYRSTIYAYGAERAGYRFMIE